MNVEEVSMDKKVIGFISPEQDAYIHNRLAGRDVGITKRDVRLGLQVEIWISTMGMLTF